VVAVPGGAWDVFATGIASTEQVGAPVVGDAVDQAGGGAGYFPRKRRLPRQRVPRIREPQIYEAPPHHIGGAGNIVSLAAVGRPYIDPGRLTPTARRRKDERELLLMAA
jgi:hypothetical protein